MRGYGDGGCGPGYAVVRAQGAALVVRAMGWEAEEWGTPFSDQGMVDAGLWRAVGTLAHHDVARGWGDGTYRPAVPVASAQVVSLVTRAMVARGHWQPRPDDPALYPNVPAASGHRADLATFVGHAGPLPDAPTRGSFAAWDRPATRGWAARALWQALDSHGRVDRVP